MRKKRGISGALSAVMLSAVFSGMNVTEVSAAGAEAWTANTTGVPQYHATERQMEKLNRGLVASYRTADNRSVFPEEKGVYLSWRLLGDESLANQAFDIYRSDSENGTFTKIASTGAHDATNYIDTFGTAENYYKVVKAGAAETDVESETAVKPGINYTAHGSSVGNGSSEKNSFTYVDIPINRPDPVSRMGDGETSYYYSYDSEHEGGANDASVGDLDGDGDYEIVLKWDPTDSKDSAGADYTGNVYIDAYEIDTDNSGYKWRIDLGKNVTAGAHYTQYIVYDFDGDGRSEIAMQTAPGSIDGQGKYVTAVGDTERIRSVDNTKSYIGTSGSSKGKNISEYEFYTIFDGETGAAICTTDAIPLNTSSYWGDTTYNRSMRFLAGVAYLDGVNPSLIECRGYYERVKVRAYSFDGTDMSMQWEYDSGTSGGLFGQGFHNLGIADIDNDGCDEIVYGSACLDNDGKTVLGNTGYGHGDAQHTSDFNNDGVQESFVVHEEKAGYTKAAGQFKVTATGETLWSTTAGSDTGRGVMDNIDDSYALGHPDALALGWESSNAYAYDFNGKPVNAKPSANSRTMTNFLVYWDGDLSRELLDDNIICKYYADTGKTTRFFGPSDGYSLTGGTANNYSKSTPSLCADIWGDWREEVILPVNKDSQTEQAYLRIYTSTIPTDYRLTTLMHDSQYRCAVAWQNVSYNQPAHTSYYIGSAALAKQNNETMNYLAPATLFTNVGYGTGQTPPESLALSPQEMRLEKGTSKSITVTVEPSDASRSFTWITSDPSVATVSGGLVTAVGVGETTITAVSKYDESISASCTVTVWAQSVTGIALDKTAVTGVGLTKQLTATVLPLNASDKGVTWSSSDTSVVSVDGEGRITGISEGMAVITATSNDGGYTASCNVSVNPMAETDVTGSGVWQTDNTDSESVLSPNTADAATMTQSNAGVGANFYRDIEKITDGSARLTLRFTTGGKKLDGTNWNWSDHEYTLNLAFLGEGGSNILTLSQPYADKAGTLTSKTGGSDEAAFSTVWSEITAGLGNIQGSAERWIVEIVFDYDNDTAEAVIKAADSDWNVIDGQYTMTFDLGGLSLERVECYTTKDGNGAITCQPMIEGLSYIKTAPADGAYSVIFERGTNTDTAWSSSDLYAENLTKVNEDTAELLYSPDAASFGRIYYSPTKPGTSYSSTLKFDTDENASVISYDVDWYFGNATNRFKNYEYIQFGDNLRLGWISKNGCYYVLASTDGGINYYGHTGADEDGAVTAENAVFAGNNTTYTKHIQVVFDKKNHTIKSLTFDGKTVDRYTNYQLPETDAMDGITFGFDRGGSTENWEYPNGLESILVLQYADGAEVPEPENNRLSLLSANSFENETDGWIVQMSDTDQIYKGINGLVMYVDGRTYGDGTLGFKIDEDSGSNVLAMESGRFSNDSRGPRFTFSEPELFENDTVYTSSFKVKPANYKAVLYYGDSTTEQANNNLDLAAGEWSEITVTVAKVNGIVTRTIYVNGTAVDNDNVEAYPVFWGNGNESSYAEVFIDDLLVTSNEVVHATVNGKSAAAFPVFVNAEIFYGQYTYEDGTTAENKDDAASLADQVKIKAGDFAVKGIEVYNGEEKVGSASDGSEIDFTTISAGSEALIAVIIDKIAAETIGIKVIE